MHRFNATTCPLCVAILEVAAPAGAGPQQCECGATITHDERGVRQARQNGRLMFAERANKAHDVHRPARTIPHRGRYESPQTIDELLDGLDGDDLLNARTFGTTFFSRRPPLRNEAA